MIVRLLEIRRLEIGEVTWRTSPLSTSKEKIRSEPKYETGGKPTLLCTLYANGL